ncbi:MAG: ABC transporter ATP-binding protein [Candidatus Kapaibacteriota bacterium]|jgi:ABC-2 type transport system ATP-binding protein
MNNILQVKNVTKYFGDYKASNDITFNVREGIIFGLLGPNGAGKTTMIRMINNIYYPDSGEILIFNEKLNSNHLSKMAYLPEERGLYKKVKVIDQLVYFGRLKGMSNKDATNKAKEWLIRLDASEWLNKKVQELSKGMQQKVQFIATILHDPKFIILDEPFSGFDPINAELLKNIILEFKSQGKTIILSTHMMEQVEQLCDEIAMINKGNLVLSGSLKEIKKKYKKNNYIIEFEGNSQFINEIEKLNIISNDKNRIEFQIKSEFIENLNTKELIEILNNKTNITKFEIAETSIHEIFINTVNINK